MPNVPSTITNIFIPNAKTIFCHNILLVFFDTFIASTKAFISSFINTISAASIAASDPIPPMAIPISALASTGASFTPSPTKASLPLLVKIANTLHVSVDYLLQDSLEENSSELSISIEVRSEKEKALIYSIVDGLRKGLDNFE